MFSSFLTINMYHQNTDFYILETNPHNANARTYWETKKRRMMRETQNGIKEWAQRRQKSSQKWGYESTRFCSIRTAPRHSLRLQACQTPHTWQRSANFKKKTKNKKQLHWSPEKIPKLIYRMMVPSLQLHTSRCRLKEKMPQRRKHGRPSARTVNEILRPLPILITMLIYLGWITKIILI